LSDKVSLPVFCGPLEILVLLARRLEVDPLEVDVARVARQTDSTPQDLEEAGRMVEQVGALVALKSGLLCRPRQNRNARILDPAQELTGNLEEFRRLQERTAIMERILQDRSKRHTKKPSTAGETFDIEELSALDIGAVFADLLKQIEPPQTVEIHADQRTVEEFLAELMHQLKAATTFDALVRDKTTPEQVGYFLAVLEGGARKVLRAFQNAPFETILIEPLMERAA